MSDVEGQTEPLPEELEPKDGEVDPRAWARRMAIEFAASRKEVKEFHDEGALVLKRFRDERSAAEKEATFFNAYPMNIQTQRAMILGKIPKIEVERRFSDANDDLARVASTMASRLLTLDMCRVGDGYADALAFSLDDRLQPGLGVSRVRYKPTFQTVPEAPAMTMPGPDGLPMVVAEAVQEHEEKSDEDVEVDYLHWKDFLWSAGARVPSEVRWGAHKSPMTKRQVIERFSEPMARLLAPEASDPRAAGESLARSVPMNHKREKQGSDDGRADDPWPKADVWEVWSKEYGCVLWYVEGYPNILDYQDDPLGLDGFFPWPKQMRANLTTSTLVPRSDFMLARDQYRLLDRIESRRALLIDALRVAGCYDKNVSDLVRLVKETNQNELIPVDNWAMFAEKGGIKGNVDFFPIDMVAGVLEGLSNQQDRVLAELYQITGFSDIMRGEALDPSATATEQRAKTRFASVRMQRLQEEWTTFANELQSLKLEVICKHFDAQTIIERSNVMNTPDAPYAQQAAEFLKSNHWQWRVEVKPRSTNLQDFAAMKAERTEFMTALTAFVQGMAPVVQMVPGAAPYMLEILKWYMAAQKDSGGIESTLDEAIAAAEQMLQQPQATQQPQGPSPEQLKLMQQQMKGQQDMAKVQADLQAKLIERQADVAAKDAEERSQAHWNIIEAHGKRGGGDAAGGAPVGILGGGLA